MKIENIIIEGIDDIINTDENVPDFRNHFEAFENAIALKKFHVSKTYDEYVVHDWMYMHSDFSKKIDYFKNKNTRKSIEVSYA